jgi:hypothetical protein
VAANRKPVEQLSGPAAPAATAAPERWYLSKRAARWLPYAGLLLLGFAVLFPACVLLPQDDEGLFLVVDPTKWQVDHFGSGMFWNPLIGFGMPQPGSESLTLHPFALALALFSMATSIALLYQVQLWIGLISIWALCRHLGISRWIAAVCAFTFGVCTITIQLLVNFWPDLWVTWTFSPLLVLVLLKLLEAKGRRQRVFWGVATGLGAGLLVTDGHLGVVPTFGFAFAAFLVAEYKRALRVWPWLALSCGIAALVTVSRVTDVLAEWRRSTSPHVQQIEPFDPVHFLFYPHNPAGYDGFRTVAFGLPFVILVLAGLVWRPVATRYGWGLRAAVVVSFVAWFMPIEWFSVLSANYLFGQPLTLFAVLLAGVTLQKLWMRLPRLRPALVALAAVQVAIVGWGFYDGYYRHTLRDARSFLAGQDVKTLKNTFENQPIYRFFEARPDHGSTRVLMSPGATVRLFRTLTDYQWSAWAWHGLRMVNTHVRGVDVSEFQYTKEGLHGEIRGQPGLWKGPDNLVGAKAVLDVLNLGYVLALPDEKVARGLVPVQRFQLVTPKWARNGGNPVTTIVVYRNPAHWPDAVVLSSKAKDLTSFAQRKACSIPGLLCDDLSAIPPLRRQRVLSQRWSGTTLDVRLSPSSTPQVLMVSQLYRPGWQATLSDGRTISGYRLFGGVVGFDLPPGATTASIRFHPTSRIAFAALSWATVLGCVLFLAGAAVFRRRRSKPPVR